MLSQSHMLNQGLTSIVDTRVSPYLRADEDLSNFLALHFVEKKVWILTKTYKPGGYKEGRGKDV